MRRFNLHTGDMIEGRSAHPKDGERYFALTNSTRSTAARPEQQAQGDVRKPDAAVPQGADETGRDIKGDENITGRIIDIIAPIGKGQRALLVAPPKSGKTVMMQNIAHAIAANYPEPHDGAAGRRAP